MVSEPDIMIWFRFKILIFFAEATAFDFATTDGTQTLSVDPLTLIAHRPCDCL